MKSKVEDKTGISLDKNDSQADVKRDKQEKQQPAEDPAITSTRKAFGSEENTVVEAEETQSTEVDTIDPQAVTQEVIDNATLFPLEFMTYIWMCFLVLGGCCSFLLLGTLLRPSLKCRHS